MNDLFSRIDNLKKFINLDITKPPKRRNRHYRLPRPSAININNYFKDNIYSLKQDIIIENESSDSNSMLNVYINNEITLNLPTLSKISKTIFDENTIMIVNDIKYFPKEAIDKNGIGLLMVGIESWVNEENILYFLEQVPDFKIIKKNQNYTYNNFLENKIKMNYIKFFNLGEKYCAYVNIQSLTQIKIIGDYFFNPLKLANPTLNSKGDKIDLYYAYNLLSLTKSFWYGVILRNLPKDCSDKSLFQFCDSKVKYGIKYCLKPFSINDIICSIIVCNELQNAERLCEILNNYQLPNLKVIKANLHPLCCKIRRIVNDKKIFSNNGYLYNEDIENGEMCFKNSKSCVELLCPEKLEFFNKINIIYKENSSKQKEEKENKKEIDDNTNNNIKKKNIKKKKKIKDSSINLLKSLKNILDLKSKRNELSKSIPIENNKNNLEQNNNNNNINNILEQSNLKSNNNIDINDNKVIDNKNIIINNLSKIENKDLISNEYKNEKIKNENDYSNNITKYYTYNFPDKSFFDDLEKEKEISENISKNELYSLYSNNDYSNNYRYSHYDSNYSYHKDIKENDFENIYNNNSFNSEKVLNRNESDYIYKNYSENFDYENRYKNYSQSYKRIGYSSNIEKYYNNYSDNINNINDYYYNNIKDEYSFENKYKYDYYDKYYYSDSYSQNKSYSYRFNYSNNKNITEKQFYNEYNEVKKNIKNNLEEIREFNKNYKNINYFNYSKFRKIINENLLFEKKIIKDIKKEEIFFNENLTFEELDKKINKIKKEIDEKYLGKKRYFEYNSRDLSERENYTYNKRFDNSSYYSKRHYLKDSDLSINSGYNEYYKEKYQNITKYRDINKYYEKWEY